MLVAWCLIISVSRLRIVLNNQGDDSYKFKEGGEELECDEIVIEREIRSQKKGGGGTPGEKS